MYWKLLTLCLCFTVVSTKPKFLPAQALSIAQAAQKEVSCDKFAEEFKIPGHDWKAYCVMFGKNKTEPGLWISDPFFNGDDSHFAVVIDPHATDRVEDSFAIGYRAVEPLAPELARAGFKLVLFSGAHYPYNAYVMENGKLSPYLKFTSSEKIAGYETAGTELADKEVRRIMSKPATANDYEARNLHLTTPKEQIEASCDRFAANLKVPGRNWNFICLLAGPSGKDPVLWVSAPSLSAPCQFGMLPELNTKAPEQAKNPFVLAYKDLEPFTAQFVKEGIGTIHLAGAECSYIVKVTDSGKFSSYMSGPNPAQPGLREWAAKIAATTGPKETHRSRTVLQTVSFGMTLSEVRQRLLNFSWGSMVFGPPPSAENIRAAGPLVCMPSRTQRGVTLCGGQLLDESIGTTIKLSFYHERLSTINWSCYSDNPKCIDVRRELQNSYGSPIHRPPGTFYLRNTNHFGVSDGMGMTEIRGYDTRYVDPDFKANF